MADRELYFISGSPPCWTIMLALEIKGLAYQQRRLDNSKGDQKSPEFLAVNPRGKVPALLDGERTVCETLAILAYLDAAYPEPELFGGAPFEIAAIWQIICEIDSNLRNPVGAISRPLFRGKAQEFSDQITKAVGKVRNELGVLEARLSADLWLAGNRLSAADLVAYPVVMQLLRAVSRDDAAPLDLGLYPLGDAFPTLDAWCHCMESLPGYHNAYPPRR
jgi:glutathione S-transferase